VERESVRRRRVIGKGLGAEGVVDPSIYGSCRRTSLWETQLLGSLMRGMRGMGSEENPDIAYLLS
jgi:hypothetical protein